MAGVLDQLQPHLAAGQLPRGNPERIASLIRSVAHGAADLALAGHLSATGKGGADPEMLIDDLFKLLGAGVARSTSPRIRRERAQLRSPR